ncbi:MAG: 50S ribosomal protein L9 [Eubacteriales bacterium]|nr:50S ribosomal protein L9 [Eubacteriales bacterium]
MKVLLLQDVRGSGKQGEIINVSDGYARNFLLPRNLAKIADEGVIKGLEQKKAAEARRRAVDKQAAMEIAQRMKNMTVTVQAKAGANGKLFGSVTNKEVSEALEAQHHIQVEKKKIEMGPIGAVGSYTAKIRLFAEVSAELAVEVTAGE